METYTNQNFKLRRTASVAVFLALIIQSCTNVPSFLKISSQVPETPVEVMSIKENEEQNTTELVVKRVIPTDAYLIEDVADFSLIKLNKKLTKFLTNFKSINDTLSFSQAHPVIANSKFNKHEVKSLIEEINPMVDKDKIIKYAEFIAKTSKKLKIDPKIMVAIIDTESSFKQNAVSSTGDISLAQINVKVWNPEFKRLKLPLIQEKKLKIDAKYATEVMGRILSLLKKRYFEKDPQSWFARYHSNTLKYKNLYLSKLKTRIQAMNNKKKVKNKTVL